MCYSSQIVADHRHYVRAYGADIDLKAYIDLFWRRLTNPRMAVPQAMDLALLQDPHPSLLPLKDLIGQYQQAQAATFEQTLFAQKKRLADAQRKLAVKTTQAATENERIATQKMAWAKGKLDDLRRTEVLDRDARIFPGWYAPVMVMEGGRHVIKPMRYQCRPAGKPAAYDQKYPGTYNARRDNLEGFWKGQFGISHGVMLANAFYENVARHRAEGRELQAGEAPENLILKFEPRGGGEMLVACLWSRWSAPGEPDLLSFAAITDEPPPEVSAAGHDRCIIPLRLAHLDAWLQPEDQDVGELYALLDDRERPYYEHLMAA
jgi:putative SOS response-associated peptidase YedK